MGETKLSCETMMLYCHMVQTHSLFITPLHFTHYAVS